MGWFSEPTTVDDFVTYFLRPMRDLDAMPRQQELVKLFTRGYGLSCESLRECEEIAKRLVRSLKKRNALNFSDGQVRAAKARFFKAADALLTPSEMENAEAWFRELERKYCLRADEMANFVMDQWKQACQRAEESPVNKTTQDRESTDMQNPEPRSEASMMPSEGNVLPAQTNESAEMPATEAALPIAEADGLRESEAKEAELVEPAASEHAEEAESGIAAEVESHSTQVDVPITVPAITLIEATGMDDAVWAEVEQKCFISTEAWNDADAVEKTLASFESLLNSAPLPGMLFDDCRQSDAQQKVFAVDASTVDREIWFLGDIHSDLLALESALAFLKRRPRRVALVLLGDLFDDGPLGAETVLRVMRLILDDPSAVTLIVGNHDEALEVSADGGEFRATVSPCEFSEWLNAPAQRTNPLARKLGKLTVDLVERSPRALFFRDGLLAAHGGVPLPDVWDTLVTANDLNDATCLQDFVWTRPHHRRKRTIPNRSKKGAGLGYEDFDGFCELADRLFRFPVRWMIRGHDHVDSVERFASFDAYRKHPLLTINTLCYRLYRENLGAYVHAPCIAKHVPGGRPEIHCLRIPEKLVRQFNPEPTAGT